LRYGEAVANAWRYVEFFTANIRNPNTRRAYARACTRFFAWCEDRGLTLTTIRPHDVATYIEVRGQSHSAPDVKQQFTAVRMMFDWLITGQIVPTQSSGRGARTPFSAAKSVSTRWSLPTVATNSASRPIAR
jgi:site-specific recombinase XerD